MKHKMSIKWKILLYLSGFTAVLLFILWLLQTVYLDEFYKKIKSNELEDALEKIEEVADESNLEELVETAAESYDICILVTDTDGKKIYSSDTNMHCAIHKISTAEVKRLVEKAGTNGNIIKIKNNAGLSLGNEKKEEDITRPNSSNGVGMPNGLPSYRDEIRDHFKDMMDAPVDMENESIILVKSLAIGDKGEYYILLNSIITPVSATVDTIRIQLIYISIIMVFIAIIVGIIISMRVSRPIIRINETAKHMARGNYDVVYDLGLYREINELAQTLNYTAGELKKTEGLQREIIANVSHDLRTPLTMITAYAEVMRDIPGENSPENIQVIIDEAKRLTNLVNDMLDISKLQAGVSELEATEYNLTKGVKNVIDRYSKLISQDGYKVTFKYNKDDVMVYADEFKIYQVLYNLINNAINYTGKDKEVVIRQIVSGNIVRIEVIDSGEGIAPEEIENVWERYYKVDKKHKRAVMGTGLGLSIVKNILKLHDAKYGVISKVGEGCTFWFELKMIVKR